MNKLTIFCILIIVGFLYSCTGSQKENSAKVTDSLTLTVDSSIVVSEEDQFIQQQPLTDVIPEYKSYEGETFTIVYPSNVMALNQDSSAFVNGDGTAIIEMDGQHYFLGDEKQAPDLEAHYKNLLTSTTAKIVYKAKGKDYCVVSGTEGGEIFYIKTVYFELLKPNEDGRGNYLVRSDLITMKFTYLDSDKDFYNPIAATVSKSFQFQP